MAVAYRNGSLHLGESSPFDLESFSGKPTPFYVYHLSGMTARLQALQESWEKLEVFYAMKANAHPALLRAFSARGAGADVVSLGEIRRAVECGIAPERIIFSGVGKTREEIRRALEIGILQINVESPGELLCVAETARALGKAAPVAFRMNPDVDSGSHPYIATGMRENKFGMGEEFLPELERILRHHQDSVALQGLSIHIGSQITSLQPIEDGIRKTIPVFERLRSAGHALRTFDVGGGVGINYRALPGAPAEEFDLLHAYGKMLRGNLDRLGCRVLCEPGRVLVAGSGVLVAEVQYVKKTRHKTFVVLDTGVHHCIRPALYGAWHGVAALKEPAARPLLRADIVGPICESSDVLAKDREIPELLPGERLAVLDTGAYGMSMASNYNLQEKPAEYVVGDR
ncbi:MAG: diaminopimelate decarboxylase [Bdellovibrionales bacterium]|nr:diaminopimelate decarboxylase [Bdellovibrionales bacterium]